MPKIERVEFEVPGVVRGKGRPIASTLHGHVRLRTPARTVIYENMVAVRAVQAMAGRQPFLGACSVDITVLHQVPKSFSRAKVARAVAGELLPLGKPDVDNVLKAVGDGCNGVVWTDDAQICDATIRRRYSMTPGLIVRVDADPYRAT